MTSNSAIDSRGAVDISVLSVSANDEDHSALRRLLDHSPWTMDKARNLSEARALFTQNSEISVIVCDCDAVPGAWIAILDDLVAIPAPPSLILTSRLADDRLWA